MVMVDSMGGCVLCTCVYICFIHMNTIMDLCNPSGVSSRPASCLMNFSIGHDVETVQPECVMCARGCAPLASVFHATFSGLDWLKVTRSAESKTVQPECVMCARGCAPLASVFHATFSGLDWLKVTRSAESKTVQPECVMCARGCAPLASVFHATFSGLDWLKVTRSAESKTSGSFFSHTSQLMGMKLYVALESFKVNILTPF